MARPSRWSDRFKVRRWRGHGSNMQARGFRSDNDLRTWRMIWPGLVALTGVSLELWDEVDAGLILLPLTLLPGLACILLVQWLVGRDRRLGRRLSQYDDDAP